MKVSVAAVRYVAERMQRRELSGESPPTYRSALSLFARAVGDPEVDRLRRRHLEQWLAARSHVAPATLRGEFAIVRLFCRWLVQKRLLRADPTDWMTPPRRVRRLPRALKVEQVAATLAACPDSRARLIVSLCVQEGLRIGEISRLEVGDVDPAERLLLVARGKGGHQRLLPLSEETRETLLAYLADHPAGSGPLIRSYVRPSRALTSRYIGRLVADVMRSAGVHTRRFDGFTAHAGRHTLATAVLERTGDVRDVQAALGHAELHTSLIYLRSTVDMARLRQAMGGRRYRGAQTSSAVTPPATTG